MDHHAGGHHHHLRLPVPRTEEVHAYGGKTFVVPAFSASPEDAVMLLPAGLHLLQKEKENGTSRTTPPRPALADVAARVRAAALGQTKDEDGKMKDGKAEHGRPWLTALEVLERLNNVWDVREFEAVHTPLVVGHLLPGHGTSEDGDDDGGEEGRGHGEEDEEGRLRGLMERAGAFEHGRVLDMPIKFPGSHEYRLPAELSALAPLLQQVIDFEYEMNDLALESYCYLTLDQGVVPAGHMQRNEGCHTDGFQGARISPKLRADHSYIISNTLPTVFYLQPFEVKHLDPNRHNFFLDFDRQAKEENTWRPQPYDIVLMDAFCVHRGEIASRDVFRTFIRLSYTVRVFDRLGNAHNPLFDYSWDMVPRETQSTLRTYIPPTETQPNRRE